MNRSVFYLTGILIIISILLPAHSFSQIRKKKKVAVPEMSIYDVDTLTNLIPLNRQGFHKKIDEAQRRADLMDGRPDGQITYTEDTLYTNLLTQSIIKDVDHFQIMIENLPFAADADLSEAQKGHQQKLGYLKDLHELVNKFNRDIRVDPVFWRRVVNNFRDMLLARHENRLFEFAVKHADIYSLTNAQLLDGSAEARAYVYTEMGKKDPKMMIKRLSEYANYPFACEIIAEAAKVVPNEIYTYASSTAYPLRNAVRMCSDPLVQTIVRITDGSKSPLKAMAFLSDVYKNKKTIEEISEITSNQNLFFKNLVRLKLENEGLGGTTYTGELQYLILRNYIREMNDLHEEKDPVRFKCIETSKPEELYFIMVYGQDEIYTSSFVGTFKRMMERMGDSIKGGDLIERVNYDKFRTFIRMCAGYNTLSTFLATMTQEKKNALMQKFIGSLEKGNEDDLEDAVDVADAFGSIDDKQLLDFLQNEVKANFERSYKERSMKGMRVYALLSVLFNGLKASDNPEALKEQSKILGLNPINFVGYNNLVNDSNVVYQQVFFYGDKDGKMSFGRFMENFKDGKWKVTPSKYWTTITSTSGKKVVIYANNPLPEPEDEEAQAALCKYLSDQGIYPSIMIHRGHSYHLPLTMDRFNKYTKVAMLGSCGGYHNLGRVLDQSPDAHIISSKQTGAALINDAIIRAINARLLDGKNIDWINMWKELNTLFAAKKPSDKNLFVDYVPPHKNLGSLFIKAYRKMAGNEEE